jgi:hypothetical protein
MWACFDDTSFSILGGTALTASITPAAGSFSAWFWWMPLPKNTFLQQYVDLDGNKSQLHLSKSFASVACCAERFCPLALKKSIDFPLIDLRYELKCLWRKESFMKCF